MITDGVLLDESCKISVNPSSICSSETTHDDSSIGAAVDVVCLKSADNLNEPLPFCSEVETTLKRHVNLVT